LNTFAKLETIDVQTLVIAGEADLIAPPGLMRVWAGHVKNALWTTVPDAGHAIAWEKPEIFNRTVLRFLKGDGPFARVTDVPQN
jgi:pimeloyl-ACP methyl ester carboxylesterase